MTIGEAIAALSERMRVFSWREVSHYEGDGPGRPQEPMRLIEAEVYIKGALMVAQVLVTHQFIGDAHPDPDGALGHARGLFVMSITEDYERLGGDVPEEVAP